MKQYQGWYLLIPRVHHCHGIELKEDVSNQITVFTASARKRNEGTTENASTNLKLQLLFPRQINIKVTKGALNKFTRK